MSENCTNCENRKYACGEEFCGKSVNCDYCEVCNHEINFTILGLYEATHCPKRM
jgi:hypothetical protein